MTKSSLRHRRLAAKSGTLAKKNGALDKLNLYAGDVGIFIIVLLQLGSIAAAGYMMLTGVILIGSVIAVVQLSSNMYSPLMQIAGKIALISGVRELNAALLAVAAPPAFNDAITVKSLAFGYDDEPVLKSVDATFRKGKKHLIVGKSGSGKSTLLKLLGKTYGGSGGSIAVDGVDYRDLSERELYKNLAFAQQKNYLLNFNRNTPIRASQAKRGLQLKFPFCLFNCTNYVRQTYDV